MPESQNDERETFRLPEEFATQVEELVETSDLYASRSDVYRTATRNILQDHGLIPDEDGDRHVGEGR